MPQYKIIYCFSLLLTGEKESAATKSYRQVNKKPKLISRYITPQIPYNK